jgi:hypothetical protein
LSDSSRDYNESNDSSGSGSDEHVLAGEFLPYQNEPLADPDSSSESDNDDERDEDGLSASVLRQRVIMMMNETKMGSPHLF